MDLVMKASLYARLLVDHEKRLTGRNVKDGIKRVAERLKLPHGTIWGLMFRKPKDVRDGLLRALAVATEKVVSNEIEKLEATRAEIRSVIESRDEVDLLEVAAQLTQITAQLEELKAKVAAFRSEGC